MKLYRIAYETHLFIVDRKNDKYVILNPTEEYSRCVPVCDRELWPHCQPSLKIFLNSSYPDIRSTKAYFMAEIPQPLEEQFLNTNNPQPIFDWYRKTLEDERELKPIVQAIKTFCSPKSDISKLMAFYAELLKNTKRT